MNQAMVSLEKQRMRARQQHYNDQTIAVCVSVSVSVSVSVCEKAETLLVCQFFFGGAKSTAIFM